MDNYRYSHTRTGFQWGPARISRLCSDDKGGVYLRIEGKTEGVTIRVTPKGHRVQVGPVDAAHFESGADDG